MVSNIQNTINQNGGITENEVPEDFIIKFDFQFSECYRFHLLTVIPEQLSDRTAYNFAVFTPDEGNLIIPLKTGHFGRPEDAIEVGRKWLDYWFLACTLMT